MFATVGWIIRWAFRLAVVGGLLLAALLIYDGEEPAVSTLMAARWVTGKAMDRQWVPLSAISRNLAAAVVMSEDGQFCVHKGVDWSALSDVINDPDGPSRGASTIPMQTAKNLFLWPGRSYLRKGLEIPLALLVDAVWGKRRVLEIYLNVAEWGDGVYGAQAAAQHYFKKAASQLSPREAALLATSLPNPALRNPQRPTRAQRIITTTVMARAETAGPWLACVRQAGDSDR